jgi:hypothetical protein
MVTLAQNYRRARARELEMDAPACESRLPMLAAAKAALEETSGAGSRERPRQFRLSLPSRRGDRPAKPSRRARQPWQRKRRRRESFDPAKTRLFVACAAGAAPSRGSRGIPALIGLGGAHKGKRFLIPALGLTIGRADGSDVIIIDGRVSTAHLRSGIRHRRAAGRCCATTSR